MKRFICIFMIFALCFSFASCSLNDKAPDSTETSAEVTTTLPAPVIASSEHSKEFKDENGRVVYTVDVVIPQITDFESEAIKDYINEYSLEIFNEACEKAESNFENAARFMDSRGSNTPWSRKIDFEVSFSNGRYLSFIIKEYFSMHGDETEPSLKSSTFDVVNGVPCTLFDFGLDVFSANEVMQIIADNYLAPNVSSLFYGGSELTEEQKQLVRDTFDSENFYLTSDGISFYMSKYIFDPMLTGFFTCNFTWSEIAEVLKMPE
ncbi:MAG: hypothetical protein IJE72_05865 [Clostridia bacterium]|nr:hypothetical protein [Clostridia bacterium]